MPVPDQYNPAAVRRRHREVAAGAAPSAEVEASEVQGWHHTSQKHTAASGYTAGGRAAGCERASSDPGIAEFLCGSDTLPQA